MATRTFHLLTLSVTMVILAYTSANTGGSRNYNSMANPRDNPCNYIVCQNGGYCDTLNSNTARCVCPPGVTGHLCQNKGRDIQYGSCSNIRCENGGRCDLDGTGQPHCHCQSGYYGSRCESRQGSNQPTQSIVNLRCDSACSTATSCRICLPCDTCQYQTMCLAYEILVKSLDAECHAQGYQEALLMKSANTPLGFTQIKCRGSGPIRDCPQGSSCVDDGRGGGTCCRSRVGREQLENKQGYCPARQDSCGRLSCQGDIDCAGNLKCCQACGNKCTNPGTQPPVVYDPCRNFGCQNGGRCTAPADAPYCTCPTGYTGTYCEVREVSRDPCRNFVCQNGGRCSAPADVPYCQCPTGYTGTYCENSDDPCKTFRCLNGGQCVIQGGRAACECPRDYRGPRCGIRDDPCRNFQCENGGRCVTLGDEPICECQRGYRGPRCGVRDDPCGDMNCLNGGRCVLRGTSPHCECPAGYTGPKCGIRNRDEPQNPCQNMRCLNGGWCRSQGSSAYCECSQGYSGSYCENRALQPTSNPCGVLGCNTNNDRCGGCPQGWVCQYIQTGCLTCPSQPSYRCVAQYKKK